MHYQKTLDTTESTLPYISFSFELSSRVFLSGALKRSKTKGLDQARALNDLRNSLDRGKNELATEKASSKAEIQRMKQRELSDRQRILELEGQLNILSGVSQELDDMKQLNAEICAQNERLSEELSYAKLPDMAPSPNKNSKSWAAEMVDSGQAVEHTDTGTISEDEAISPNGNEPHPLSAASSIEPDTELTSSQDSLPHNPFTVSRKFTTSGIQTDTFLDGEPTRLPSPQRRIAPRSFTTSSAQTESPPSIGLDNPWSPSLASPRQGTLSASNTASTTSTRSLCHFDGHPLAQTSEKPIHFGGYVLEAPRTARFKKIPHRYRASYQGVPRKFISLSFGALVLILVLLPVFVAWGLLQSTLDD